MHAALQGSLESFKLPELFTFLNDGRRSGRVEIVSSTRSAEVYFDKGAIVFASSNQDQFRLGSILIRQKRISKEQLSEIENQMMHESGRFGRMAIRRKLVTDEELAISLKVQVSEIVFDAFTWFQGTFAYYDVINLPDYAVTISLDLPNLIMEGSRRIEEWEQCQALLPDPTAVFRVVGNPPEDRITLTVDEWKVLFLINGQRSLADLCRDSGETALHVYRLVYGLMGNKLIELSLAVPPDVDQEADATVMGGGAALQLTAISDGGDRTTRVDVVDDRDLLVSPDAHFELKDVVCSTVASLVMDEGSPEDRIVFGLSDQEYRVGRLRENEVQLLDLAVSGRHARIFRGPDGYVVEDLNSRNGTYVNGLRVTTQLLAPRDVVRFGATELTYDLL